MSIFNGIPRYLRGFLPFQRKPVNTSILQRPILMLEAPRPAESEPPAGVPSGLVDIHSHILWGIDDGAKDLATSVAMIRMAYENGTTDIVATPHANSEYHFDTAVRMQRLIELRALAEVPIRIHAGCDFHMSPGNIQDALDNPQRYTVGGRNHLMVEFADFMIPPVTERVLDEFLDKGIVPVITHPERNPVLQKSILSNKAERLRDWVEMGCLVQLTAQSITGDFGRKAKTASWELLDQELVHAVASDGHDLRHRPPRMDGAWLSVSKRMDVATARRLMIDNPSAIVCGRRIGAGERESSPVIAMPAPLEKSRKAAG